MRLTNSTKLLFSDEETATNTTYVNSYFKIYYDSGTDLYAEIREVGNYFNEVREKFLEMGFKSPILEGKENKYRVYLEPGSGGLSAVTRYWLSSGNTSCSAIKIFNFTALNISLKQIIAHEYFHAIQNAYNYNSIMGETLWFKEACANWGCFAITGTVRYNNFSIYNFINSTISMPESDGYGAVVFPLTIHKKYGGINTIKAIYEEYNRYDTALDLSGLRTVISNGMLNNGYGGGFDSAYRTMAGYLYKPTWFNGLCDESDIASWNNDSIVTKTISSTNGSLTFSENINYLSSKYYRIVFPEDSVSMVNVDVEFSNSDGRIEQYRIQNQGHNIFYPSTVSNKATFADSSLGRFVQLSGFVLSNLGNDGLVNCTVTIKLIPQDEHFIFSGTGTSRYTERRMYLTENEYADYTVIFGTSGNKVIQTFGTLDTEIELYRSNGTLIDTFDDEGYGQKALASYNTTANTTYRIRVKFHNTNQVGWTKLAITPAYADRENGVNSISKYEDILNIHSYPNYSWYSFAQNNWTRLITFTPPSSGTYTIQLEGEFDNYLYVIDPRLNELNIANVDYNDDGGGNLQAKITRVLEANIPYLIIYSQYNLNATFVNLDTGDDVAVRFSKN